jgi:hypothetical protein
MKLGYWLPSVDNIFTVSLTSSFTSILEISWYESFLDNLFSIKSFNSLSKSISCNPSSNANCKSFTNLDIKYTRLIKCLDDPAL